MALKLVIFDMDGLMLDTERVSYRFFQQVCAECGFTFTFDMMREIVGFSDSCNIQTLADNFPGCDAEKIFDEVYRRYREVVARGDVPLKPGLLPLLDAAEAMGLKKAVATSSIEKTAAALLKANNLLERFDGAVFGDMVEHHKPAPDIYTLCARMFSQEPQDCLVLEDSCAGVRAALAAGMPVIMVPDIVQPDEALVPALCAKCDSLLDVIPYL